MFRKLVSHLSYSPALISEIGFYARRLRSEDATRQVTIFFVILTIIMQSVAVFSPPESANASTSQDIIRGGVTDKTDLLRQFDNNNDDIKDIYTTVGISRSEIVNARENTISTDDSTFVLTRYGQLANTTNEATVVYKRSSGGVGMRYFTQFTNVGQPNHTYRAWIGHSANIGWFAIMKSNGSIATHGLPSSLTASNKASDGATKIVEAKNISQNTLAELTSSKPLDKLVYTLTASNSHSNSTTTSFSVRIDDILEYATLIDAGGGTLDNQTNTLSWPSTQLTPGESQHRTFVVQLLESLPSTSIGSSNPASYDCTLTTSFGSTTRIPVECPASKQIEGILFQLPTTGTGMNIAFSSIIILVVGFFAIRTRQLKKEIRIIRHNYNTGII